MLAREQTRRLGAARGSKTPGYLWDGSRLKPARDPAAMWQGVAKNVALILQPAKLFPRVRRFVSGGSASVAEAAKGQVLSSIVRPGGSRNAS